MLAHTCFKTDAGLANIFSARITAARELVDSFTVNGWRTCLVAATEYVAEFRPWFGVYVDVVGEEGAFQLTVE